MRHKMNRLAVKRASVLACAFIVSCAVVSNSYAVSTLVGVWDFEKGVSDVWVNQLGGVAFGSASRTYDATRGHVLTMSNSTLSYVDVPHNALLNLTDQITVAAWFYAVDGGPDILFSKGNWDSAYTIRLDDGLRNHVNFHGVSVSNGNGVTSSNAVPVGRWVHLAITFDVNASGNDTTFYVNGVLDSSADYGSALDSNTSPFRIGNSSPVNSWGYWNGMMDDVAIWSTPLTADEIRTFYALSVHPQLKYSPAAAQLLFDTYEDGPGAHVRIGNQSWRYSESLSATSDGQLVTVNGVVALVMDAAAGTGMVLSDPSSPSLVGVWNFESGVSDVWTNHLGGTASGSASTAHDATRGNVLFMNGSAPSYVDVPHHSLLNLTDQITIAAWFYAVDGGPDVLFSKGKWDEAYGTRLDDNPDLRHRVNFHGRYLPAGVTSSSAMPVGKWMHLMVTFDKYVAGNDTIFYTNGVLESSASFGRALSSNTSPFRMGNATPADGHIWGYWNGMLDDVSIWSTPLTPAAVRAVYALSIEPKLKYSPPEVQVLLDLYAQGQSDAKVEIRECTWRYATALSASESGVLQVRLNGAGYELVMNHITGEGLRGSLDQGIILMIQ